MNDWTVNAVDSSDVLLSGISVIEGNWFTLGDTDTLTVTENAFTNIGSGCSVNISAKDPRTNFYTLSYTSNRDGLVTAFDTDTWYSEFISAGVYTLTFDGGYWNAVLNGNSTGTPTDTIYDWGITIDPSVLQTADYITVTVLFSYELTFTKNGYSLAVPAGSTTSSGLSLNDFDIKYLLSGQDDIDSNWVTVDAVTLNSTIGWNGRSLLSLSFGPGNQQYLLSNQSIHLIDKDNNTLSDIEGGNKTYYITIGGTFKEGSGNSCTLNSDIWNIKNPLAGVYTYTYSTDHWVQNLVVNEEAVTVDINLSDLGISISGTPSNGQTIIITNTAPAHYPMVVLGSKDINSYGTEFIRTFDIDYDNSGTIQLDYLKMYTFTELQSISGEITYESSGNVIFTFEPTETTKSISFLIPEGDYILPVKNNIDELTSLKVSLDSEYLEVMYSDEDKDGVDYTQLKEKGMHYLYMPLTGTTEHTLTVELTGHTMESAVQLNNCFKYVKPNQFGKSNRMMSNSEFDEISHLITYLDNKHIFKYDNIVNVNEEIKDPAAAASFNLVNHIYNPFTICEFSTATIN